MNGITTVAGAGLFALSIAIEGLRAFNVTQNLPSSTVSISLGLIGLTSVIASRIFGQQQPAVAAQQPPSLAQREVKTLPASAAHPAAVARASAAVESNDTFMVNLEDARQYDDNGDRPPSCTIHALAAMTWIGQLFERIAMHIRVNSDELSGLQRDIIQHGLAIYNEAKKTQPDLEEGADLQHIKNLPYGLSFGTIHHEAGEEEGSFDQRLDKLMEALYANIGDSQIRVVWIKNGNEESFSVIKSGIEVIIFDSHQNKLILTQSRQATRDALDQKLKQYSNAMSYFDPSLNREINYDATPFAYAVGNLD